MISPVLATVALLASVSLAAGQWDKPSFCRNLECPVFTLEATNSDYEYRSYEAASWVSVKFDDTAYKTASFVAFDKLFRYISGENIEGKKIEMTAPVLTKTGFANGAMTRDHEVSFYIPYEFQSAPIQPSNSEVTLTSTPDNFNVYVVSFKGYPSAGDYESAANALMEKLSSEGKAYDKDHIYTAGYDAPFRVIGRHSEVWVVSAAASR